VKYTVYVTRSEGCAVEVEAETEEEAEELGLAEAIERYGDQVWETVDIRVDVEENE
jgi:hypothetical protein